MLQHAAESLRFEPVGMFTVLTEPDMIAALVDKVSTTSQVYVGLKLFWSEFNFLRRPPSRLSGKNLHKATLHSQKSHDVL